MRHLSGSQVAAESASVGCRLCAPREHASSKACVMRALCVRGMCVKMGSGGWVERRDSKHYARARARDGLGFQQDFALRTDACVICWASGGSRVCLGRLQIVRACTRASKACVMRALGERALCVREMCATQASKVCVIRALGDRAMCEGWAWVSARFCAQD